MVIGLLAIAAIPTTIGTAEAVSQHNRVKLEAKREAKFTLDVYCDSTSSRRDQVHGKSIIFRDGKMYVGQTGVSSPSPSSDQGHPFEGFYFHFPDGSKPLGLVSMVSQDPPTMNWIYVDRDTLEVKYGNRSTSRDHIVGPWDWTDDDDELGLTLEDHERFVAVEERSGVWAVYFDRADDYTGLPRKKRILDISLERRLLPPQTE